jgi:hypothetical protein
MGSEEKNLTTDLRIFRIDVGDPFEGKRGGLEIQDQADLKSGNTEVD